jgi:hypothetical protein
MMFRNFGSSWLQHTTDDVPGQQKKSLFVLAPFYLYLSLFPTWTFVPLRLGYVPAATSPPPR